MEDKDWNIGFGIYIVLCVAGVFFTGVMGSNWYEEQVNNRKIKLVKETVESIHEAYPNLDNFVKSIDSEKLLKSIDSEKLLDLIEETKKNRN